MTRTYGGYVVRLIKALVTYDRWTRKELATATGWSRARIERLVNQLHSEKVIHIDGWVDDSRGRQCIAVFTLGPGTDAKKRTAMSGRARTAAYKARKQQQAQATLQQALASWAKTEEPA